MGQRGSRTEWRFCYARNLGVRLHSMPLLHFRLRVPKGTGPWTVAWVFSTPTLVMDPDQSPVPIPTGPVNYGTAGLL